MTSIQRYDAWPQEWPFEAEDGDLVTYEDHRKIVEELEAKLSKSEALLAKAVEAERVYCANVVKHFIEELEAENKRLRLEVAHANDTADAAIEGTKELEAKLAKAVEALQYMVNHAGQLERNEGIYWEATEIARTTLAELKGQDDE